MRKLTNFNIKDVPVYNVLAAVTQSHSEYEQTRVILAESYPNYGEFTLIEGSHCSCYGFEDTQWDAIVYNKEEMNKLADLYINSLSYPEVYIGRAFKEMFLT